MTTDPSPRPSQERPVEPLAYSPRDFAQATGLSATTVYQLIKTGELPARVLYPTSGKPRYLILAADARAWLEGLEPA